jgi:hypothetical protein
MPWVGTRYTLGRGSIYYCRGVKMAWAGSRHILGRGSIYHGRGVKILWIGGRYKCTMDSRVKIPWVGMSKYNG